MSDGWHGKESQTVVVEFDEWPLGSLNAELYTIPFSCLNTGTRGRWRGRDESTKCVCSHFLDVEAWPLVRPLRKSGNYRGWTTYEVFVCERKREGARDNLEEHKAFGDTRS